MNYIEAIKKEDILKTTLTENGDTAFASSGSFNLDFFGLAGGMRHNYRDLNSLFLRSYYEDRLTTLKIMLYLRDILNGMGERNSFRLTFNTLANLDPNLARQLLPLIPKYGRWDDILSGLNTPIEKDVLNLIEVTLDEDLVKHNNNEEISLLSKWLPSINTSNKQTRVNAKKIAKALGYSNEEYRKTLSKLRKGRVLETYLSSKQYTFNYENVPSQAMLKYVEAFVKRDEERFKKYLDDVENKSKKINTKTIATHQIYTSSLIMKVDPLNDVMDQLEQVKKQVNNMVWENLGQTDIQTKAIVVRDGSSSMLWGFDGPLPMEVATSLAVYIAEQLPEPFKNHFITFSERPQLIKIEGETIDEKFGYVQTFDEVANTNISRVYQLLLDVAVKNNVKQENMVEQVIIISDMQFDECVEGEATFHTFKKKFEKAGLIMPELVFWNVAARSIQTPVTINDKGVKLVSGYSQKILEMVVKNNLKDGPLDFMRLVLEKYSEVDDFVI